MADVAVKDVATGEALGVLGSGQTSVQGRSRAARTPARGTLSSCTVVQPRSAPISTTRVAPAATRAGSMIFFQKGNIGVDAALAARDSGVFWRAGRAGAGRCGLVAVSIGVCSQPTPSDQTHESVAPQRALPEEPECPPSWSTGPPDFVGIGAQRCGTTWWFGGALQAHPLVAIPPAASQGVPLLRPLLDGGRGARLRGALRAVLPASGGVDHRRVDARLHVRPLGRPPARGGRAPRRAT